jgi:hypothetical protein
VFEFIRPEYILHLFIFHSQLCEEVSNNNRVQEAKILVVCKGTFFPSKIFNFLLYEMEESRHLIN